MKEHCEEHTVKKLAMPRIGCGLDRLDWNKVRDMIKEIFKDMKVELTIYTL
jgi:O-acetyl-ADP-ribose deacetylase (regulator of RNase III)